MKLMGTHSRQKINKKMASFTKRKKSDGAIVYDASIKIRKHGQIVHREKRSFSKLKLAKDWALRREVELQEQVVYKKKDYLPIKNVIDQYIKEFQPKGRSKNADLNKLKKRDIANVDVNKLTERDLIKHTRQRNKECQPQTAANDLIWLNGVIKTMSGVLDIEIDLSIFDKARGILRTEGLIAKSRHRDRRPTKEELLQLSRYFYDKHKSIPMLHIMWFAIYSARRQSEIMRIEWNDINHENKTCLLKNMKDPRIKGLKKRFKLPKSAYKIIIKQPKIDNRIFPYNSKTISTYFTDACNILNIKDLRFHDLRHEATSRLFERGLDIVQVQQVTLHSSWNTLKRYANLDPGDLDI